MFGKLFSSNKASIDEKSNNNIIVQDSVLNNPTFFISGTESEMIKTLGALGRYDDVQQHVMNMLSAASKTHPLYPVFSAKPNNELHKLVSTPETEDAFKRYPKRIKGTFRVDYKKYPYMNKSETPWEYAYRTQTQIELETTAYQEFLGDIKDPFPITEYADGMVTVISAPEFPAAVCAAITSGEISIPILLRRKPCMEYGKMIFGSTTENCGLDFKLITYKDQKKADFTITKITGCDLLAQLQRERLFVEMSKTKHLTVSIGQLPLVDTSIKEEDLAADMFNVAPYMVKYLESLILIEERTSCKFDLLIEDVLENDYRAALILVASLEGKWCWVKANFDGEVRLNHEHIPDNIFNDAPVESEIIIECKAPIFSLQGQLFSADKYTIVYRNARINNIASVRKNKKKRKKNILLTFKPIQGKDFFYKFHLLEGIHLIPNE